MVALKRTSLKRYTGLKPGRSLSRGRDTGPDAKTRQAVLERDGKLCVRCGQPTAGRPYSLHHRKRRSQGGRNTPENLITLCGSGTTECHGWVHRNIATSRDSGWLVLGSDDPASKSVETLTPSGLVRIWLLPDGSRSYDPPSERAGKAAA